MDSPPGRQAAKRLQEARKEGRDQAIRGSVSRSESRGDVSNSDSSFSHGGSDDVEKWRRGLAERGSVYDEWGNFKTTEMEEWKFRLEFWSVKLVQWQQSVLRRLKDG